MKKKLIFLGLLIAFNSCANNVEEKHTNKSNDTTEYQKLNAQKNSQVNQKEKSEKIDNTLSFVLSCGSGCALTYNLKDNHFLEEEKISVTFSVTMWVDEKVSDKYSESYVIKFHEENVQSIYSVDNKEYLIQEDSPDLFKEIKNIGNRLHQQ